MTLKKSPQLILFAISFLIGSSAFASSARTWDADSLQSSDHSKVWTPPAATDTIVGRLSTDTLTNKSISGASNTLSQLPIAIQTIQEVPSGTVNGTNTSFTLSFSIVSSGTLILTIDGGVLQQGSGNDYTISGTTITMLTAPATGQKLIAVYSKY